MEIQILLGFCNSSYISWITIDVLIINITGVLVAVCHT